jgi:endonuclease/exonuclease/phosphatase family metal-dependent hydrolase
MRRLVSLVESRVRHRFGAAHSDRRVNVWTVAAVTLAWTLCGPAAADDPIPTDSAVDAQAFDAVEIGVMSFNIRTSLGRDGDNIWPNRKALVADTIRQFSPHVVGLPEALNEQIQYLDEALPEYRWFGVDRGLNGGTGLSEATPIFYRYREITPIESGNFWLSATPALPSTGRRPSRIVTWARFFHRESGGEVYVFNTHLTIRRGERQVASIQQVLARIEALPADSAVIFAGDFNSVAGVSQSWRAATAGGILSDAWVLASERRGPAVTWSGFAAPRDVENRIDWILVGGPLEVESVETVVHSDGLRYPSDHFPVYARVLLSVPLSLALGQP